MNIIIEITKTKDKCWFANHKDAKGIKLWWFGIFWTRDCQIESASNWKTKFQEQESKAVELTNMLKLVVGMCESIGTFKNGVEYQCMDEGEVQADNVLGNARDLIYGEGVEV